MNTLVLVHRQQLLSQWRERLDEFLTINETLPELSKKRGRKKEQNLIGHMAAGKDRLSSIVDEARLDTLFLAMPIAWKGTLQQYAGRLHR